MKRAVMFLLVLSATFSPAQKKDALRDGFENPPEAARPRVWWHWMNGNITKEGIKLDLEWMKRSGLAGFQNFDAAMSTPQIVDKRLAYMTPEWKDAFKYATTLADQMGLEMAIAGSPGWSESGGPWVKSAQAMKKYVWSETPVEGGKPFTGVVIHPPSTTGEFQNLPISDAGGAMKDSAIPELYADSAVVAFKVPDGEAAANEVKPTITVSSGTIDSSMLSDGDLVKRVSIPAAKEGEKPWVQFEYSQPQTIRGMTIVAAPRAPFEMWVPLKGDSGNALEASDDGKSYHTVFAMPKGGSTEHTYSFAPVTAKYFRMTFNPKSKVSLAELVLHPGARVNHFEEKAGVDAVPDLYGFPTPDFAATDAIPSSDVIDLTSKMSAHGKLDWTPPPGKWVVLRIGYSLLGVTNHPATKEATGLEVDKLNGAYVKSYMDAYLDSYKETVGADLMGKRGIQYVISDSWEAGSQNWTDDMLSQFQKRRGYDPHPWLPVLAGRVVESSKASDQFLWDFRKTIADLIAEEHYGQIQTSLRERGMRHYGESHESGRVMIADGMEAKKLNDIPMSAMWVQKPGVNKPTYGYNADDRESASVAHIYGQNIAAAESMTTCDTSTAWAWSPATLKPTADQEFLNGINRFVIHESAHQPLVGKAPGITLGPCGQWFNRNDTWAEQAGAWTGYLARNSFLLQQGHFAADILYFYGEDSNVTIMFEKKAPDLPAGYNFDYINADGLIHELNVSNGRITTKSGMEYQVLALDPNSQHMSLPVLKALSALVHQGAVVAGRKPTDDPSKADDQEEFKRLNDELFGDGTGMKAVGKGKVYAGQNAEAALKAASVAPDFSYGKPATDSEVLFVHRKLAAGDIYFVDNRSDRGTNIDAQFRVTGKAPELWYSETGKVSPASYAIADGHTTVPLHLEPWGTVFVVFRTPTKAASKTLPKAADTTLATLDGTWELSFQPDRGAPASLKMEKLISWSDSTDVGVKYFSGTGTYSRKIDAPSSWFASGSKLLIDLGDVKNLAEVTVNGKSLGIVWHTPYRVDVTGALKPGSNDLSIKVVNAWVNRLIGDQQPDAKVKYTFATIKPYRATSSLQASGLLGPVKVIQQSAKVAADQH
ncbi:MAG: glycoside hydrolase [Acidobacteria bacterium]|nr:glycoside hydrolase [Acidobacteriota bacterium]